jgi:D-beta-D-heptose 7-phosphate kinase/D-beta-D-heptose 1-phosphate adenosyltransferase
MTARIPDFSAARVLVVGDVMLDRYWHGGASRISPEAPVPVVRVEQTDDRPGGAANVAVNVAALGAGAVVVGAVGDDAAAAALAERLRERRVESVLEPVAGGHTVTKLRVISRNQQLIRLDFEDGFPALSSGQLLARFRSVLEPAGVVVLSDYGKGALRDVGDFVAATRVSGKPVIVDPKGSDFSRYRGATLITPNLSEFEAVAGRCDGDAEIESRGEKLRRELELQAVLVTRGEAGMTLIEAQAVLHLPTVAREVYDVTGAGDTVVSTMAASLAAGLTLADATRLANLAAGIVVGKLGTASVSVTELRRALYEREEHDRGVVDEDGLLLRLQESRARGERLVMTNGCFDILHAGHVTYLEQARRLGERLIVAVNDDDSVRRLKGPERPVNSVQQRMHVLAGLATVDWVVPFSEDTPERLICRVIPDVLVKGGDYRPEDVAGGSCVTRNGGEVVILGYIPGQSTSNIVARIRAGGG